ncbi:hypothetical protein [Pelobacter propionicus]|uniref:Uncharacterized protein n=1 Tax=Pelobacter propionicus (strain DSM 2379 / NBRC 103807 / OttBd1) TaxID=338966 RepID=A1ANR3_PELPD|nr:hypothetical protein [Pelobacter propionicus]ABK98983.1 hypothetical protein Ppro_1366 [Pelobacter propionicus DSM 2379]
MTLEEIRTAQTRIHTRHGKAVNRIAEIEASRSKLMMDYALGVISGEELDTMAVELPKLREIANEDNSVALEHFAKLERSELERQRQERNRLEVLEARRQFADRYNSALGRTRPPNLPQLEGLAHMRPGDFPGPVWHRFTSRRLDFAALPESELTYGEYCGLEPYDPEL